MSKLKNKVSEGTKKRRNRTGDTLVEKFQLHLTPDQITPILRMGTRPALCRWKRRRCGTWYASSTV